jgi:UDP-2-acetamido-2-deoxy-ribo-hexuluronate aminotransferase
VPFTWISSAESIALVGARPIFVDIDPLDYNLDVGKLAKAISPKTRAIMPVSLFGQIPDMEAINRLAEEHRIPVLEDAAQSFGATRNGLKSCAVSTIGSTSFFPAKPLGCYGDGGALFTSDDGLAEKMRAIRTHGGIQRHHHPLLGMNGRFDTLQASILIPKLAHFPDEVEARNRIGARYSALLKDVCETPQIRQGNTHVYAQYTIRIKNRSQMQKCRCVRRARIGAFMRQPIKMAILNSKISTPTKTTSLSLLTMTRLWQA